MSNLQAQTPIDGKDPANGLPSCSSSYNSNSDDDFNPDLVNVTSSSSSSDAESTKSVTHNNKVTVTPAAPPTLTASSSGSAVQPTLKRKRGRPRRIRNDDVDKGPVARNATESVDNTEDAKRIKNKAKKARNEHEDFSESGGALDSGDEATIQERAQKLKKRKELAKAGGGNGGEESGEEESLADCDDDEGGAGGWVKTRSQRRTEQVERKPIQTTQGSTVDVDAIWANIANAPIKRTDLTKTTANTLKNQDKTDATSATAAATVLNRPSKGAHEPNASNRLDERPTNKATTDHAHHKSHDANKENETITIQRTYRFAGETTTETRTVPRDSAEARLYLASLTKKEKPQPKKHASDGKDTTETPADVTANDPATDLAAPDQTISPQKPRRKPYRRPLRRPSRFDPNPTGHVSALPEEASQLTWFDRLKNEARNLVSDTVAEADQDDASAARPTASASASAPAAAAVAARARAKMALKAQAEPPKLTTITKSALDWAQHVDAVEGLRDELDRYGKGKEDYLGKVDFLRGVEGRRYVDGKG